MTFALCFHCGEVKWGAICPCRQCGVASSGDMGLDIAFSDHRMTYDTLQQFGAVVAAIRKACDDDQIAAWAFITYVSTYHSDILTATPPLPIADEVDRVLSTAEIPTVDVKFVT